jgi:hypothetical protein
LNRNGVYNAYVYTGQNPINEIDPGGYFTNDEIAFSFRVPDIRLVGAIFATEYPGVYFVGGRWGFLKLLQEAKNGDELGWLSVGGFGISKHLSKGELRSFGCDIHVGGLPLGELVKTCRLFCGTILRSRPRVTRVIGHVR